MSNKSVTKIDGVKGTTIMNFKTSFGLTILFSQAFKKIRDCVTQTERHSDQNF